MPTKTRSERPLANPEYQSKNKMAISLDSTSNSGVLATVSSNTYSHTCTGSNLVLIVTVETRGGIVGDADVPVSGITYAGAALTKARSDYNDNNFRTGSEIWYKVNPATGVNNIITTWTGTVEHAGVIAISLTGVDQTNPIGASAGRVANAGTNVFVDITIPQDDDESWLVDCFYHRDGANLTVHSLQTQIAQLAVNAGGDRAGASYKGPQGLGARRMSWTAVTADDHNETAVSIAPIADDFRIENVSTSPETTAASSVTLAHNIGTVTGNQLLVVLTSARDNTSAADLPITGITYNTVALTKVRSDMQGDPNRVRTEIWYLVAPGTGTNNVVVSFTGTVDRAVVVAVSFYGAAQSSLPDAQNGAVGTATSNTLSVTTVAANAMVLDAVYTKDLVEPQYNSAQLLRARVTTNTSDDWTIFTSKDPGAAGATNMIESWTNNEDFAHSAASFAPFVAAESPRVGFRSLLGVGF